MENKTHLEDLYNISKDYELLWNLIHEDKNIIYFYSLDKWSKKYDKIGVEPPKRKHEISTMQRFKIFNTEDYGVHFYQYHKNMTILAILNLSKINLEKFTELCNENLVSFVVPSKKSKK